MAMAELIWVDKDDGTVWVTADTIFVMLCLCMLMIYVFGWLGVGIVVVWVASVIFKIYYSVKYIVNQRKQKRKA